MKIMAPEVEAFSSFFLVLPAWILVRNTDTDAIWIRIHNILLLKDLCCYIESY